MFKGLSPKGRRCWSFGFLNSFAASIGKEFRKPGDKIVGAVELKEIIHLPFKQPRMYDYLKIYNQLFGV